MDIQKDLFYKMLHGDEDALKYLLDKYHNYLMVVGTRYLTDKLRVEDVIHDVFADLWNKKSDIEIQMEVKAFLRGAVINKCLAILRKDSRMEYPENHKIEITDRAPSADLIMDRDQLKKTIHAIIEGLPEKCRRVFQLSRYQGLSHQEISEEMDISKKTIENHMTRALKTLKNELTRQGILIFILFIIKISFLLGVNT